MKSLYIVRHAKSNWSDLNLDDLDRPLKRRGKTDAKNIATLMHAEGIAPDTLLTSPALRAYDTAQIFRKHLKASEDSLKVMDALYLPDFPTLLKLALYLNDEHSSVFIFGHEPSLSTFINYFVPRPLDKVVTASVTRLDFETETWKDLATTTLKSAFHRNRHDWDGYALM